jgi:beta-N-acetylhexosaminidase
LYKKPLLFAIILLMMLISSCSILKRYNIPPKDNEQILPNQPKDNKPIEKIDPIQEQIDSMTIDEKIGQMVMASVEGYSLDANGEDLINKYNVGGFIVLGENVRDTEQLQALVNSLKSANSKNKLPLFISTDEEGGRVSRMPDEFKDLPSNRSIGKTGSSEFALNIGKLISEELISFGINMDFAPVLDINSNPKNTVIGDRSFGPDANIVTRLGIQEMKGMQSKNIISVVKHFPGHGDTSVDSHVGLPVINNDADRLKGFELVPFANAIQNNTDGIMIAHILLPKIDSDNPASMSKTIITDMLRDEMDFKGIVITDDMTMGAIVKNYNIGEAAVRSINAGSDIILVCHGFDNQVAVIDALRKAASDGRITQKRIDESLYRIIKLKNKYMLADKPSEPADVSNINQHIKSVLNSYMK